METDFLVIGSGIAGLSFALKAAREGKVAVIAKEKLQEGNTNRAQGGIAVPISKGDKEKYKKDILDAGCGLCDMKAVDFLVENAERAVRELAELGTEFDRKKNGKFALGKEAAHSERRIVHAKDRTGMEIERALIRKARNEKNITLMEGFFAVDLIVEGKECFGINAINKQDGKTERIFAKVTVLATGGIGEIYEKSTNSKVATGDGIAMAYRAGAEIQDMEFVQFHPTMLAIGKEPFLISEAVRGEGAVLRNENGKEFMEKYDARKELAPRDVVARAIYSEMKRGRKIFLDATKIPEFEKKFPTIYEKCRENGIDARKEGIPVTPAAHHICGGVKTDLNGETGIRRLFAVGEVARTGVHGANRLASTSTLEAAVFADSAFEKANEYVKSETEKFGRGKSRMEIASASERTETGNAETSHAKNEEERMRKELKKIMWENVGIVREPKKLNYASEEIKKMETELEGILRTGTNASLLELKNMLLVGKIITEAALKRKESVGAHYMLN